MERKTFFVDVLLPLPIAGYFTYRVPYEMNNLINEGIRVVVQFGQKKVYTALVRRVHEEIPAHTPKYIISILDEKPIVNTLQFNFWEWIANYYLCSVGEVMSVALPSALKLTSETQLVLNPDFNGESDQLSENEFLIFEAIEIQEVISLTDVMKITGQAKVIPLVRNLIEKGVILLHEELTDSYKPKEEAFIQLNPEFSSDEALHTIMDKLEKRAFKQLEFLMGYLQLAGQFDTLCPPEINKRKLTATVRATNNSALSSLVEKTVFLQTKRVVSRFEAYAEKAEVDEIILSEQQQRTLSDIKSQFETHDTVLLHGVTSSGKTELYIKLIDEQLKAGKQVLYLLPEIALTSQIITRLRKYFGDFVGVYHSKFNEHERVEIWHAVNDNKLKDKQLKNYPIILGARSALFLPFENLGLIIVDEEHDSSYKQHEPAPRYNARDSALVLATMHHCKTVLGSATPSVESWFNAKSGKYGFVQLLERFGGIKMPELLVADLKKEYKEKSMSANFSSLLIEKMKIALEKGEQVILFRNRRGFSPRMECETCHFTPECKNCDVTMVYHKQINLLKCHYCGYTMPVPSRCPECGSDKLRMRGFGTEKIEEDLQIIFPKQSIARMDLDTVRGKRAHLDIITKFENREIDILIGTQMVSKGLDFDNVSLVGVLSIDTMINFPDFRAHERGFQMLMQVSGRAGRKSSEGKVVVQSSNPWHSVIRYVMDNNFEDLYSSQLGERKQFLYPPFVRLINIKLLHRDRDRTNIASNQLAELLRQKFGKRILGPEYPLISRVRNRYIKQILIKVERTANIAKAKELIKNGIDELNKTAANKSVRIIIDVDPQN